MIWGSPMTKPPNGSKTPGLIKLFDGHCGTAACWKHREFYDIPRASVSVVFHSLPTYHSQRFHVCHIWCAIHYQYIYIYINIPPMLAYIPYMGSVMGFIFHVGNFGYWQVGCFIFFVEVHKRPSKNERFPLGTICRMTDGVLHQLAAVESLQ